MRSYFDTMLRYFELSGRSTRMQYWMFQLVFLLEIGGAVWFEAYRLDLRTVSRSTDPYMLFPISLFICLVHIVPNVTVQVRRLHDIGKSGAWYLLNFVPFGSLLLLYWTCCPSEEASNYYDSPAPSSYARARPRATRSTIPRTVRMGAHPGHAQAAGQHSGDPQRFI